MVSNNVLKDIQRLISITNTGLAFSKDPFDQERYQDIREILQDLVRETTDLNSQELSDLFRPTNYYDTPLIDVRAWIVKDRKLCLVKGQGEETWALPGGFGEVGYSPKENILKEIQEREGIAYLFISHDREVVSWFTDEKRELKGGRIYDISGGAGENR